jgi:hypothetical protein
MALIFLFVDMQQMMIIEPMTPKNNKAAIAKQPAESK